MTRPLDYNARKGFRFGRVYSDAELSTLGAMSGIDFHKSEVQEVLFKFFEEGIVFASDEQQMQMEGQKPGA